MNRPIVKPRLYRNRRLGEWACSDRVLHAYGWGATPEEAYSRWVRAMRLMYPVESV